MSRFSKKGKLVLLLSVLVNYQETGVCCFKAIFALCSERMDQKEHIDTKICGKIVPKVDFICDVRVFSIFKNKCDTEEQTAYRILTY